MPQECAPPCRKNVPRHANDAATPVVRFMGVLHASPSGWLLPSMSYRPLPSMRLRLESTMRSWFFSCTHYSLTSTCGGSSAGRESHPTPSLHPPHLCLHGSVRLAVVNLWQIGAVGSHPVASAQVLLSMAYHPRVLHPLPPVLHPLQSSAMLRLAGFVDACPLLQHLPFRLAQGLLKTMLFPNLPAFPPSTGPSLSPTTHVPRLLRPASTPTLALMVSRCIPYTTWRLLLSFLPPWAKHCTLSHHTQSAA